VSEVWVMIYECYEASMGLWLRWYMVYRILVDRGRIYCTTCIIRAASPASHRHLIDIIHAVGGLGRQ
jgi:hypothetical protein